MWIIQSLSLLVFNILTLLYGNICSRCSFTLVFMLLLLLLSRFSHVRFCVTPETAAYQAPPSLGFGVYKNLYLSLHCLGLCEYTLHSRRDIKGHKEHAENSLNMMRPSSLCPFNCHALSAHHTIVHKIIAC